MNPTETMLQEINGFLKAVGDPELNISCSDSAKAEIDLLHEIWEEYVRRLREKMPSYRLLPQKHIPDMFLNARNARETELLTGNPCDP